MREGFCREPVYFMFWAILVEAFIVMSIYAYTVGRFGSLTEEQSVGYAYACVSNFLLMGLAFICSLYFYRDTWKFKYALFIIVVSMVTVGLSIPSIVYLNYGVSKEAIKEYVFQLKGPKVMVALDELQQEGVCCGIDGYEDYKYRIDLDGMWSIPLSCCVLQKLNKPTNCGKQIHPSDTGYPLPDNKNGCILGTYEDLRITAPHFHFHLEVLKHLTISTPIVGLILTTTLLYYLWKYGRPKWEEWFRGSCCDHCLAEMGICGKSMGSGLDEDNDVEEVFSGRSKARTGSLDSIRVTSSSNLQSIDTLLSNATMTDLDSPQRVQRQRSQQVHFSETLVVYPYNSEHRFVPIRVDNEGNPLPTEIQTPVPVPLGYRFSLARLRDCARRRPVPRLPKKITIKDLEAMEDEEYDE